MKAKRILAIVFAFLLGGLMAYTGSKDLTHSIQLKQRGKSTTGEVISGRERVSGRFRTHSYYLTILFKDEAGQSVRQEVKVSSDAYTAGQANGSIKVFYLPEASSVCAAGNEVELRYGNLLWALVLLGVAIVLVFTFDTCAALENIAAKIEEKLKPMMEPRHEYVSANASDFRHLDLDFYDQGQRLLEQHGFVCQGDRENVTLLNATGRKTMLRLFLSADQTTQAFLYHLKVTSGVASKDFKVLDLQTMFSNGMFICTSNAKSAGKFESPPLVLHDFLPEASQEAVLEKHSQRVNDFLEQNPDVTPTVIHNAEEFQKVMDALQKLKADFRRQQGISKEELERISGKSGPAIDAIAEILKKRWETRSLQGA